MSVTHSTGHRLALRAVTTTAVLAALTFATAITALAADPGQPGYISINGSMEGNLRIHPGDWVDGGYQFTQAGQPSATVQFTGATVTLSYSCNSNGTSPSTYVIGLTGGPYTIAAGSSAKYPYSSGDSNGSSQNDPAKWQGAAQVPALCGAGNAMWVNAQSGGATFAANVQSSDTTDRITVQFHYGDSTTIDCNDPSQNTPPTGVGACGKSWSSSPTVTPGPIPSASTPEGAPVLLAGVAGVVALTGGTLARRRRRATPTT